jgi:hypothetical protein
VGALRMITCLSPGVTAKGSSPIKERGGGRGMVMWPTTHHSSGRPCLAWPGLPRPGAGTCSRFHGCVPASCPAPSTSAVCASPPSVACSVRPSPRRRAAGRGESTVYRDKATGAIITAEEYSEQVGGWVGGGVFFSGGGGARGYP